MIGGGRGAFIGGRAQDRGRHGRAGGANRGGVFERRDALERLRCGLLPRPGRVYGSYAAMAKAEAAMPPEKRLDFVVIVTPNHEHFGPAKLFLEAGFNVVCDKPATFDLAQAKKLRAMFGGGQGLRADPQLHRQPDGQAGARVRQGRTSAGSSRSSSNTRRAGCQTPRARGPCRPNGAPTRSVRGGGLHGRHRHPRRKPRPIHHRLEDRGDLRRADDVRPGRMLDDDGNCLVRYKGAPRASCSPARLHRRGKRPGHPGLRRRAALEWHQEHPNELVRRSTPTSRARSGAGETCTSATRPSGSPGYRRPSRGVPRGFRQHLPRGLPRPSPPRSRGANTPEPGFPDNRRRGRGDGVHRGGRRSSRLGARW